VPAGTLLRGYDPARPGQVVLERTFATSSSALADAEVSVAWPGSPNPPIPRGTGFLRVSNGLFAGLLIVAALVQLDPELPASAPDCTAAEAAAHNAALDAAASAVGAIPRR
jgi:hypothetical protein